MAFATNSDRLDQLQLQRFQISNRSLGALVLNPSELLERCCPSVRPKILRYCYAAPPTSSQTGSRTSRTSNSATRTRDVRAEEHVPTIIRECIRELWWWALAYSGHQTSKPRQILLGYRFLGQGGGSLEGSLKCLKAR